MPKKANAPPAASTGARYVGGDYWPGIPARDLTPAEWAAIDPETRARLIELGLYVVDNTTPENVSHAD